jgi:putative nucleotidyltransferase with HDIG domain
MDSERLLAYETVVMRLGGALRAARLYASAHPILREHIAGLFRAVQAILRFESTVLIGFVGGEIIADRTPLQRSGSAYRADVARDLAALGIQRIAFERGLTAEEVATFVRAVADATPSRRGDDDDQEASEALEVDFLTLPHLKAGRIPIDTTTGRWGCSTLEERKIYGISLECARTVWDSAQATGQADLPIAQEAVEHLAEAVTTSGGLMIGLTAMKAHDEYTFTHMVNVSILAMAQGRSLGIEGQQLRDLGLAALLHDIGKVRTPLEVLNKPGAFTPAEFEIMKRHSIDGATILRSTTEMPRLAPIVAFEHHLRLDGTGYPAGLSRPTLNLATSLCGIADVYDAMRSKRQYQQAFPTDRIIEVMRRNDGKQFDQHLVRRFIQLMGVYPPATLVQLGSGEVAVVTQNDGPNPERPSVRVLFDREGNRLASGINVSLWRLTEDDPRGAIANVLDPARFNLDAVEALVPA